MDAYYRGDQESGITAPNLCKNVDFSDHIVRARGKKTRYTSVSLEPGKINDFGEQVYILNQEKLKADAHGLVEHQALMQNLREQSRTATKARRIKAIQAIRYARKRLEGLVDWRFDISGIDPEGIISWAYRKVQPYFARYDQK
ncbi:MAG: hypothetical protein JXR96_22990 [Deltaproteobacteria bacterium]|nr:hypothetical protein [Deltaproteobacteria bacterium]